MSWWLSRKKAVADTPYPTPPPSLRELILMEVGYGKDDTEEQKTLANARADAVMDYIKTIATHDYPQNLYVSRLLKENVEQSIGIRQGKHLVATYTDMLARIEQILDRQVESTRGRAAKLVADIRAVFHGESDA